MKRILNTVHDYLVFERRVRVLAKVIANELPANATVLDVGAGDGSIAFGIQALRKDISIEGIDVFVRPHVHIPVTVYDGDTIPFPDGGFDALTFVDVLHHTPHPGKLLLEAARVARKCVIVKDHLCDDFLAVPTLKFMDWVGNWGHDVRLPYNYLPRKTWDKVIDGAGLCRTSWHESLGLYPFPFSLIFERRLHFVACLAPVEASGREIQLPDWA